MADVAAGAKHLYECLDVLDNRLIDKLYEALNAERPKREEFHGQAKELIKEYQQFRRFRRFPGRDRRKPI